MQLMGTTMFAARGFRLTALLMVLLTAFSLVAVDTAQARRGGSFGSRGTRTFQTVPATPTAPNVTAPVQRSMTAPAATSSIAQSTAAQRAGWFGGGLGGWLLGGLLFSGLFGMMFGAGFGGIGGFISLIVQVMVLVFIFRMIFGRRMRSYVSGGAGGSPFAPRPDIPASTAGPRRQSASSRASQRAGRRDEIGVTDRDLDVFERRLTELQDAYSREDYDALRAITTPEMMGYLAEELAQNAGRGVRNEVFDVRLLSGDIAEAWREGRDDYATASLRYESRDITRDKATGQIVSGSEAITETTEAWTFVRHSGGEWLLSAIQDTGAGPQR